MCLNSFSFLLKCLNLLKLEIKQLPVKLGGNMSLWTVDSVTSHSGKTTLAALTMDGVNLSVPVKHVSITMS